MNRYLFIAFLALSIFQSTVIGQSLNSKIDKLIQKKLPNATVAVYVKDVNTNRVIYHRNKNKLLSPASAVKLYTAVAALYGLGPDYQFVTKLFHKANRFYLQFNGSPSLTEENLSELLSKIKKQCNCSPLPKIG